MTDLMRRPTDEEQAVIAAVWDAMSNVGAKRLTVVGVGMGKSRIEDAERGRWVTLLGKPVRLTEGDPKALTLLIEVPMATEGDPR